MEATNQLFWIKEDVCCVTSCGLDLLEGSSYDDLDLMDLMQNIGGLSLIPRPRSEGVFVKIRNSDEAHAYAAAVLENAFCEARPFYAGGFSEKIPVLEPPAA